MDHQSDVQSQPLREQQQQQRIQEQQNIIYIQQQSQNFRNHNYSYLNDRQADVTGNQSFQNENASFGQFENHYPFVTNGNFSSSNSTATIITDFTDENKIKNVQIPVKNAQYLFENDGEPAGRHQTSFSSGNFQSVDLQGLNYQQTSPYFIQNVGNHYQLNDNLVPMYHSSGSGESSDESSASNISQLQYSSDSSNISNNQFEIPLPVPANNQLRQNLLQFQQKDFLDNYMALLHQDPQVPRCDSSKSEAAESTCSSLSSGSTESQSENENILRLPLIVNPLLNNNANVLHSYQSNIHNNLSSYSNSVESSDCGEFQTNYVNQANQNILKYNSFTRVNPQNLTNENINSTSSMPSNNQINNLVVVVPKNPQNCLQGNGSQPILQNPSSQELLNSSKFIFQNQKVNQQKIYDLINVSNPVLQEKIIAPVHTNQTMKVNSANIQNKSNQNDDCSRKKNDSNCGICHRKDDRSNGDVKDCCNGSTNIHPCNDHSSNEVTGKRTSFIQNTSDSSVINSNFVQSNMSSNGIESENPSAMLLKETSDKTISRNVSDVNNSVVDFNSAYLIKNHEENKVVKNNFYDNSSAKTGSYGNSGMNLLPVPAGWRRLLVDGSIIYLSPTNVALSSIEQMKMYLQTTGTCKCGLECPVNCDSVFNFDPKVISRPWDSSDSEQTRLCNHKRKAHLPPGSSIAATDKSINRKEIIPSKRKKKKNVSGSGVSVSKLLAQRDQALAAAAAAAATNNRCFASANRDGSVGVGYQNAVTSTGTAGPGLQYQNIQVVRPHTPGRENGSQLGEAIKLNPTPARTPDDKVPQFPCINVISKEGTILNLSGMSQLLPETHSTGNELIRSPQLSLHSLTTLRQEIDQTNINQNGEYNQCAQDFVQNSVITSKPEGVVLGHQGMLFTPNTITQRPRSIPPWHQTRLSVNKKPSVPESPVIYEKVPYMQQPMAPPTVLYEDVSIRKKPKSTAKIKKASQEPTPSNQPSFMENPSAYLAQQTALLHDTISRPNFNMISNTLPSVTELPQNLQNSLTTFSRPNQDSPSQVIPNGNVQPSRTVAFSVRPPMSQKIDQNNFSQSQVGHSKIFRKEVLDARREDCSASHKNEMTIVKNHICSNSNCTNCKNSYSLTDSLEKSDELETNEKIKLIEEKLRKTDSNVLSKKINGKEQSKDFGRPSKIIINPGEGSEGTESISIEENPVTSSTEKDSFLYNHKIVSDSRPIQGGTVSTSIGSPQPQSSPNSLNLFKQEFASLKSSDLATRNSPMQISSTNCYVGSTNPSSGKLGSDIGLRQLNNVDGFSKKDGVSALQGYENTIKTYSSDKEQKQKFLSSNLAKVTTSSSECTPESDAHRDHGKVPVTSSLDEKESQLERHRFMKTLNGSNATLQNVKNQGDTGTVSNNSILQPSRSLFNLSNQNLVNVQIAQKGNTKSPLEMVQSVVSSIQTSTEGKDEQLPESISANKNVLPTSNSLSNIFTSAANTTNAILTNNHSNATSVLKTSPGTLQAGHILVSSNGQYLVAANGNIIPQANLSGLKLNQTTPVPPMSASPVVTNVTGAVTQVLPAVGQQVLGQPTVLVNAVPAPFVIQPGVMAVETGLGRLAVTTGNVLHNNVLENGTLKNSVRGVVPTEKVKYKKGTKKRKNQVTSLVQMTSPNNVILNQPFGQQNFAVSPGGSVQPLQALTLVQGKQGQIVMNNQGNFSQFNSQPQQINLLQPVNLTSVPNFPAFQQFIVPGLGNMVMSTDGTTTILPDTTNIGVQLQLQNVHGQNLLTPVQNTSFLNGHGILATPGMFIRAPSNQQKIIQNNASSQFLSPNNGQFLVNQFQGQLSPLIAANLSPNQQLFATSPQRQSPQEFIQIIPTSSSPNTTVVQQNTTIVQQQTTMVSNNQNLLNNSEKSNFILKSSSAEKPIELQIVGAGQQQRQCQLASNSPVSTASFQSSLNPSKKLPAPEKVDFGTQQSVSTQTNVSEEPSNIGVSTNNTFCQTSNSNWSGSPPDTTTHSPVESDSVYDRAQTPMDESPDGLRQAMVQYVSSSINESESDILEGCRMSEVPKVLTANDNLIKSKSKSEKNVESSTMLQEVGVQIQMGRSYLSSDNLKSKVDECVVSSRSDVSVSEKLLSSQSNISSYQKDKVCLVDALLGDTKSDDEGLTDFKEKLRESDLVWGPARGFPSWPGKLVGPIDPGGRVLVRWFGGHSSPTKVNVSQLQSLSQGLDAHHRASNKGRKNRRLNAELEAAIQEAMLELDRMTGQGKKTSTGRGRPRRLNR